MFKIINDAYDMVLKRGTAMVTQPTDARLYGSDAERAYAIWRGGTDLNVRHWENLSDIERDAFVSVYFTGRVDQWSQ